MFLITVKSLLSISKELRYINIKLLRAEVLGCEIRKIGDQSGGESMNHLNMIEPTESSEPPHLWLL